MHTTPHVPTAASPARATRRPQRTPTPRRYALCPPTYFDVQVVANPWMRPDTRVDRTRALAQWTRLRAVMEDLGHDVDVVEPVDGLDDMVFAANSGVALDGRVLRSRYRCPHRRGEEDAWAAWFAAAGFTEVRQATSGFEGEGDVVVVGRTLVVAQGPRTDAAARAELAAFFPGVEVVGVELVDPRWYHLDTAMFALDDTTIAWFPPAFSARSRAVLAARWPDAVVIGLADALAFGANAVSDGRHVLLPVGAAGLATTLRARGYDPVPIDVSELLLSGGAVKCATLEVHA